MAFERIRYREREVLTAAMLGQEQAWHITTHRRHLISAHVWGVVSGLALEADAGGLHVQPGYAVDGYGRELVLTEPANVSAEELRAAGGAQGIAVWLLYAAAASRAGGSGMPRLLEQPEIRLTAFEAEIDPSRPGEVPQEDLSFPPLFLSSEEPDLRWPVYLGRVLVGGAAGFKAETDGRPSAGVVAETIAHPAGAAWVQLGTESSLFAVSTGGVSRIDLKPNGTATLTAPACIVGDLRLAAPEGSTDLPSGVLLNPPVSGPAAAQPWSAYHTLAPLQPEGPPVGQLRFEIQHPGDKADPANYRLTIGHRRDEAEQFVPCVQISADFNVRLLGNLTVEGELLESPVKLRHDDPRLANAMLDSYLNGATAGSAALEERYTGGVEIDIQPGIGTATVALSNTGNTSLRDWVAFALVTRDGAVVVPTTQIGTGLSLAPQASVEIVWTYPTSVSGRATLEISVFAVAPPSRVVQAAKTVLIQIPDTTGNPETRSGSIK